MLLYRNVGTLALPAIYMHFSLLRTNIRIGAKIGDELRNILNSCGVRTSSGVDFTPTADRTCLVAYHNTFCAQPIRAMSAVMRHGHGPWAVAWCTRYAICLRYGSLPVQQRPVPSAFQIFVPGFAPCSKNADHILRMKAEKTGISPQDVCCFCSTTPQSSRAIREGYCF